MQHIRQHTEYALSADSVKELLEKRNGKNTISRTARVSVDLLQMVYPPYHW